MAGENPKDVVRRFYEEAINGRDAAACGRLLTDDFTHNGDPLGSAGQTQVVQGFLDGFDPLHDEILMIVGEGDLVAAHQRWTGRHTGTFAGVKATGKDIVFTSTAFLRIDHDRIVEAWDEVDLLALFGQIGFPPSD